MHGVVYNVGRTMTDDLVAAYLEYLTRVRTGGDAAETAWVDLDELLSDAPEKAWPVVLEILGKCDEEDVSMMGAGVLERLLSEHPKKFAARFEERIRSDDRFLRAFQYAAMTGVPLPVQQQINAALLDRGVDPKLVVEYDEVVEE